MNENDFMGMRQDALNRVREMQRKAQASLEHSNRAMLYSEPVSNPQPYFVDNNINKFANIPQQQPENVHTQENYNNQEQYYNLQPEQQYNPQPEQQYYPQPEQQYYSQPEQQYYSQPEQQYNSQSEQEYQQQTSESINNNSSDNISPNSHAHNTRNSIFSAQGMAEKVENLKNSLGETITSTISGVTSPITDIMDTLGIGSDKLIIVGLILVLLNEKADKMLLLALGYLLIT